MNEADSPSINLDDLRLVPDWLREEPLPPSKQYAGHEGRDDDRGGFRGDRDRRGPRAPYPGGGGGGGARGGGPRDQQRGGGGPRDRDRRGGPPSRGNDRGPRNGGDQRHASEQRAPLPPVTPAPVKIEFLPEERCLANIIKQIRTTHMAYPLFGTARMFLQEPERHLLDIGLEPAATEAGTKLYQLGENGPVALDRQVLERIAFEAMKDRFYVEQTVPKDPPKGNFTSVARCRLSGTVLGPTNYHGYQPALRALYEAKFSRRMSFEDYRQSIEVVSDPALVERWKQEASTVTTISTREGEPPAVLQSMAEARVHFRQHYFDGLLREGTRFGLPGSVARTLPEAGMMMAIRLANENELRYPAQFVQHLRKGLQDAGLHIFKHRKRVVYVAVTRPVPFSGGAVSANVAAILEYVGQKPGCTRKDLANRFLLQYLQTLPAELPVADVAPLPIPAEAAPATETAEPAIEHADPAAENAPVAAESAAAPAVNSAEKPANDPHIKAKAALAGDLRFLVQAGHIIEFHNGTFDLPLTAKTKEEQQPAGRSLPKPNPLFAGGARKGNQALSPKPAEVPSAAGPALDPAGPASGTASDYSNPSVPETATEDGETESAVAPEAGDLSSHAEAIAQTIAPAPEAEPIEDSAVENSTQAGVSDDIAESPAHENTTHAADADAADTPEVDAEVPQAHTDSAATPEAIANNGDIAEVSAPAGEAVRHDARPDATEEGSKDAPVESTTSSAV